MFFKKTLYILIGLNLNFNAMADVQEIVSIEEAEFILEKADKDTLVLFDVDYVLNQPADPALQMRNVRAYKQTWKEILGNLSPLEHDIFTTLIAIDQPLIPIEKSMNSIIHTLQKKNIKVIALTAILTGAFRDIKNTIEWRYETLKDLGFDFSSSFNGLPEITFQSLGSYRKNYPSFYKGLLFSNGDASKEGKGKVFKAFLASIKKTYNWAPKSIIFIDDRKYNLDDIKNVCATFTPPLQFTGFLYEGAKYFSSLPVNEGAFKKKWIKLIATAKEMASQTQ